MIIKFCNQCGQEVKYQIPEGDNKPRAVCQSCGFIQYENPKVVNACIVEHEGKILLGKRTIEPRNGFWNLPAGFMENGEATQSGAIREVKEELLADLSEVTLFGVYNVIQSHQVHVYFRGKLVDGKYGVGVETSEAELFLPEDIPWDEIAFPVGAQALRRYLQEMKTGEFTIKEEDVIVNPNHLNKFQAS